MEIEDEPMEIKKIETVCSCGRKIQNEGWCFAATPIDSGKNMKIRNVKKLHHLCDRCRHQNRLLNSKQDKKDPSKLKCHHIGDKAQMK